MLNQFVTVGRITEDPTQENGKAVIKLAVPRSYKNTEGEYETDFISCLLFKGIAENTCEYCKKGDLVGIKGRMQSENDTIQLIAEKITFLSSRKEEE